MPKRLVLCLDGTWGRADGRRHTNVVSIMRAIAPLGTDGKEQIVYYDKGVGTGGRIDRLIGGLTGSGLDTNVRDAYIFLGNNWQKGDEVFVFGFSRGAFTARSLVGFIAACGLLGRHSLRNLSRAWAHYRSRPPGRPDTIGQAEWRSRQDARLQQVMEDLGARDVRVNCIGVWDTVGSLGVPLRWFNPFAFLARRHVFHDTTLSQHVDNAFHAVAVDEKRGAFAPTLWQRPIADDPVDQVVEQVWFAGVHSDVGGGYESAPLASVSLQWMMERAARAGLTFLSASKVRKEEVQQSGATGAIVGFDEITAPDPLAMQHESRSFLYAMSWLLPYQRVVGGRAAWTRRLLPSRNAPQRGHAFINEAIHPSVLERWDQEVQVDERRRRYRPRNVEAAKDHVPVAAPPARVRLKVG